MRTEPQVSSISVNNWIQLWNIRVHYTVDATSNPQLLRGHANRNILTFLKGADPVDSGDKNGAIDTRSNQQQVDVRINVNVAFLAVGNRHPAVSPIILVHF
jgi:hypothetical protein